ncbi:MAG TPA: DUF1629 domain-containing protein [Polyangiaceae bacterium]|jgi:hypothetical protein|nr:DUF1629 domain-containing protein [Polyangiaceae bacterium]
MDYEQTFLMEEGFKRGAVRLKPLDELAVDQDIGVARGEFRPRVPLRFIQYEGTRWLDFVGTQRAPLRLVSERVLEAFVAGGVTGWEPAPVEISDSGGAPIAGYGLLVVVGRCGAIDNSRSMLVDRIVPGNPKESKVWKGLYVEEKTWDGRDLFNPERSSLLLATEKVKRILEREKATNIRLESLLDVERLSLV